eukprot:5801609-Alexandrium_andersonii.AAC.1
MLSIGVAESHRSLNLISSRLDNLRPRSSDGTVDILGVRHNDTILILDESDGGDRAGARALKAAPRPRGPCWRRSLKAFLRCPRAFLDWASASCLSSRTLVRRATTA